MAKDTEVILIKTVRGLGNLGDRKSVKRGYAFNFLFPQELALPVNKDTLFKFESIRKIEEKRMAKEKESAEAIKKTIDGTVLAFEVSTHDDGKLYGSIGHSDIIQQLKEKADVTLDKRQLPYLQPFKEIGDFEVVIECGQDVQATVKVAITSSTASDTAE